jgi:lambda family phage portal protein
MNLIDRTIAYVAPRAALKRMQARAAIGGLDELVRKFDGATRGRRGKGWDARATSANTEIEREGSIVRYRARDLVRNNPWARKAAQVVKTNVVGSGIKASLRAEGKSKAQRRFVETAKTLWKNWAETTACDFYKRKNLYSIQRQVMQHVFVDGEVLVRQRRNKNLTIPVELQVLEIDYLDTTRTVTRISEGGGYIDQGVEMDGDGRVVAYYLYQQHPGNNTVWQSLVSIRVPREEILHIYHEERAGQIRGVSEMAASMLRLRDYDEYEDAQLIRQKIAACFAVFIHGDESGLPGEDGGDGYDFERLEPGMIERLPAGKEVSFASPPETSDYDPYTRRVLQGVSAGMGVTYESMTNDYSNVNFSSARMGWIETGRRYAEFQADVVQVQLCAPAWEWFLQAARVAGKLPARGEFIVSWTPPRREMIDPVKETEGLSAQVRAGFVAWQDVVRQLGGDPEEVVAKMKEDRDIFDTLDAKFTTDPRWDPARKPEADPEAGVKPAKAKKPTE